MVQNAVQGKKNVGSVNACAEENCSHKELGINGYSTRLHAALYYIKIFIVLWYRGRNPRSRASTSGVSRKFAKELNNNVVRFLNSNII